MIIIWLLLIKFFIKWCIYIKKEIEINFMKKSLAFRLDSNFLKKYFKNISNFSIKFHTKFLKFLQCKVFQFFFSCNISEHAQFEFKKVAWKFILNFFVDVNTALEYQSPLLDEFLILCLSNLFNSHSNNCRWKLFWLNWLLLVHFLKLQKL